MVNREKSIKTSNSKKRNGDNDADKVNIIRESNMYMERVGFINEGDSNNLEKESPPEDVLISTEDEIPELATSEESDNENQLSELTQSEESIVEYIKYLILLIVIQVKKKVMHQV